jgi:hypothetical protein
VSSDFAEKVDNSAGRDHWGAVYSTVLAGGGIRGGQGLTALLA